MYGIRKLDFFYTIFLKTLLLMAMIAPATAETSEAVIVTRESLLQDVRTLSSDAMQGRRTSSEGGKMAADYIAQRFKAIGVDALADDYRQVFHFKSPGTGEVFRDATNIVGTITGTSDSSLMLLVVAHYDHMGMRGDTIYNGADDNASGVGALLAAAEALVRNPPRHTVILLATDAEEQNLTGARYFIAKPIVPLDQVAVVINMDMLSISDRNQLYAAGTYHYPFLRPLIEKAAAGAAIDVLFGHDSPDLSPADDWTFLSDHGPFHAAGIPFVYFGVEDHAHYHQPSDTFDKIHVDFYVQAVTIIIQSLRLLDAQLQQLHETAGRAR